MTFQPSIDLLLIVMAFAAERLTKSNPDLARRIREGDQDAFRVFFENHHSELDRFLSRMQFVKQDRQDIVQQAFIAVWDGRDSIDPDKSLRAFLFRIARNSGLNHKRSRSREAEIPDEFELESEDLADFPNETDRLAGLVREAVKTLPDRRRQVFQLCFLEGLTYRETAEVLDISPKTVENQIGHALKTVRQFLDARTVVS